MSNDRCPQEFCRNWAGDGEVCVCVAFDLERDDVRDDITECQRNSSCYAGRDHDGGCAT